MPDAIDILVEDLLAFAKTMHPEPTYPKDHLAGMAVPKGGSNCAKCEYLADNKTDCTNEHFQKWNGSPRIPGKIDEYCSDWFEAAADEFDAAGTREGSIEGSVEPGIIFHGVNIVGFSSAEQEMVQAYMSRIPPELIVNVKKIVADPALNAIHGRYRQASKTIYFNPKTFTSRIRLGKGPAKIPHAQLTMVHEFGHALYTSLPEKLRDEWRELSGWMRGTQEGQEIPYTEKRPGWPHMTSEWTHRKGTEFTRHYAEKNPDEDAADTFAFCLLSKPAQAGSSKRKWMADLMMSMIRKYPRASIQGPETTGS